MYEKFFGLADTPFRLTPDPRYLFLSKKHAEAIAHLRLGLTESSGFVCITGDVGAGKTTVLRAFLGDLGPEVTTAYVTTPALSAVELLRKISRELGLAATSESQVALVDELSAHLLAQRQAGHLSMVVVDEAQALSVELLEQIRLLLNLETTTEKLLRIVLVGQPQLRGLLMNPGLAQLNQRITLRWHIGPLAYRETAAYLRHRLRVAGGVEAMELFTVPAIRLVHSLSGGIPRLVNMIAHRSLLAAFLVREPRVTRRLVLRAYREIQAVPLPGTLTVLRKAGWATAGIAFGVGLITLGAPQIDWLFGSARTHARSEAPAAAPEPVALAPRIEAPTPVEPPKADEEPKPADAAPPVPADTLADLQQVIAGLDAHASARAAVESILAVWHVRPLDANETGVPEGLEQVAWRRGLEDLPLTGNLSMLRLLDLPAFLEIRGPGTDGPRYAALMGMDDGKIALAIGGARVLIDAALLDRLWLGKAHVLWRDFERLGPTFGPDTRGPQVVRLQELLRRAGAYGGNPTGAYDASTAAAVLDFQRSRLLSADGLVGRFTRIVLYGAAGGYARPALATPGGTTS